MNRPAILSLALLLSAPCAAQTICRWEDAQGNVIYASGVVKGARKTRCFDQYAPPVRTAPPATGTAKRGSAEEAGFPKVDAATQKRRDDDRRRILEQELAEERSQLERAKRALSQAESAGSDSRAADTRNARDALAGHERNIAAIEKEIARLR